MAYIYKIFNDVNDKVYIGKTIKSVRKRWSEHLQERKRNPERPLYRAMNKHGIDKFHISIIEEVAFNQLNERECFWIEKYQSYHYGYNATLGGDGSILYDYELIAEIYQQNNSITETAIILKCDEGTVSDALKELNIPIIQQFPVSKSVAMLDINGTWIQNFSSIAEASKYIGLSRSSSHISAVCKGKQQTAYGYKWIYINE